MLILAIVFGWAEIASATDDCDCGEIARFSQGDLNLDGFVDQQDLSRLIENYGTAPEGADGLALGDLDLDGSVQMTDISRLIGFWGLTTPHEHELPSPVIHVFPDPTNANKPLVAPVVVHVHATESRLGRNDLKPQRALFEWSFGDAPGRQVVPDPLGEPGSMIDLSSSQQGFNAAYLYEKPGVYEVTLVMTNELGGTARTSIEFEVVAPEGENARQIRYVDSELGQDSLEEGWGTSPDQPWRSFGFAMDQASNHMVIRFRRDRIFPVFQLDARNVELRNLILESYGEGARPILHWKDSVERGFILRIGADADTVIVRDLAMTSDFVNAPFYDPERGGERCDGCSSIEAINLNQARNVAIINCSASNTEKMIDADSGNKYVLLQGNESTITRKYQYTIRGNDYTILGCRADMTSRNDLMRVGLGGARRVNVSFCDFGMENSRGSTEVIRFGTVKFGVIHHSLLTGAASKVGHNNELTKFFLMSDCSLSPRETDFGEHHLVKLSYNARDLMFRGNEFNVTKHDAAVFINARSSVTDEDEKDIVGVEIVGNVFKVHPNSEGRYSRLIRLADVREPAGDYDVRKVQIVGNDFTQVPALEFAPDVLMTLPESVDQICGNALPAIIRERYPYVELTAESMVTAELDFRDLQRDPRMVGNVVASVLPESPVDGDDEPKDDDD